MASAAMTAETAVHVLARERRTAQALSEEVMMVEQDAQREVCHARHEAGIQPHQEAPSSSYGSCIMGGCMRVGSDRQLGLQIKGKDDPDAVDGGNGSSQGACPA